MMFAFRRVALASALLVPAMLTAQGTGRLTGAVVDAETGAALPDVRIEIVGSPLQGSTTVDGRFNISGVPAGTIAIRALRIGYAPKRISGIVIAAGDVTEQPLTLTSQTVELGEISVTAEVESGSVSSVLDEQRNSTGIINAVSAEQIARSPDGDAAAAVQRVSGVTVQDGRYVSVRGLGDRYTQASLNGARIPSPEPEKKVVPLDLFPSSLLASISTSKTFTPDQPGDFSGGSVDIRTRDFPGRGFLGLSVSGGYNDAITGQGGQFGTGESGDWLAFGASDRRLPTIFGQTDFNRALTPAENNALVNSLRNAWSPSTRTGSPNGSFGASLGGRLPLGSNGLTYLLSSTYSNTAEVRTNEVRALAATLSSGNAEELERFEGTSGLNSVLWGGIANFSSTLGSHTKVSLNNTYNRTMDNEGRREIGSSENYAIPLLIQRTRYVERNIYSSQLVLHHEVANGRLGIDWGGTLSGVQRTEPDRSEFVSSLENGTPQWFGFSNEGAVRTFGDLSEHSTEGHADFTFTLGDVSSGPRVRVGGLYRSTSRDAQNRVYSISLNKPLPVGADELPAEEIFGGSYSSGDDSYFRIVPLSAGGSYTGDEHLGAGYAMIATPLGQRFDLVAGARLEHDRIEVNSLSTVGEASLGTPEFTDVLPSLALTWHTSDRVNLRLSATQTLSRPEYRELSPILYREVLGGDNVKGNPDLKRALIQNYDLRFEFYPRRGEILSVALFAKQFRDPIERIYQGTSGTRIISYVNADGAHNYGVELEARKSLDLLAARLENFSVFTNATIMHSRISLGDRSGSVTNADRKMVGQAPYVLNAGLTWNHPTADASATILFNRVGERITEAGERPLPDVIEQPRSVVDLSVRFPLAGLLSARIDAKNLLDADYRISQGGITRHSYRAGRVYTVGFNWSR
ncbi:MAG: TonB-dependent receptor [Gemmatimonadota bacterium]